MSEPLSPERLAEIGAEVQRAYKDTDYYVGGMIDAGLGLDLLAEVERLRALHEQAAALVEAHETGDGSNLCEMLAAKIRALLPSQ